MTLFDVMLCYLLSGAVTGVMWFYVLLCADMRRYLALCGVMWRHLELCGTMWRYVALCGVV